MPRALVIDDNRQPADLLCQLLTLLDVTARPAYGSRAAMFALKEQVPDIVFVDLNMPGVDGYEVMAFLQREPRLVGVPVVVVTADDSEETRLKAIQEGAVDVIVKPASLEALEKVLRQAKLV